MNKIEEELEVTSSFLLDNNQSLVLNSEENFYYNCSDKSSDSDKAMVFLQQAKKLFSENGLTEDDKQALFSCITEIYFNSKK